MIRSVIALEDPARAVVGINLVVGEAVVKSTDLMSEFWPADCPALEVVLILQDKLQEEDVTQAAELFLKKVATCDVGAVPGLIRGIPIETDSALEALTAKMFARTLTAFRMQPDVSNGVQYLDIVLEIGQTAPWFREEVVGRPENLFRKFIHAFQDAFEETIAERPFDMNRMLGIMRLSACLFLKNKLAVRVVDQITHQFIGSDERPPSQDDLDCVKELLRLVRPKLEETELGKALVVKLSARLLRLQSGNLEFMAKFTQSRKRGVWVRPLAFGPHAQGACSQT